MKHESHVMMEFMGRIMLGIELYPDSVEEAIKYLESAQGGADEEFHKAVFRGIREAIEICNKE